MFGKRSFQLVHFCYAFAFVYVFLWFLHITWQTWRTISYFHWVLLFFLFMVYFFAFVFCAGSLWFCYQQSCDIGIMILVFSSFLRDLIKNNKIKSILSVFLFVFFSVLTFGQKWHFVTTAAAISFLSLFLSQFTQTLRHHICYYVTHCRP